MDTKVEQELFGYDPSDPDGLDKLHSHIHTDFEELELRTLAAHGTEEPVSKHAAAMGQLTGEDRAAYKKTHYLELYGSSSAAIGRTS